MIIKASFGMLRFSCMVHAAFGILEMQKLNRVIDVIKYSSCYHNFNQ